MNHHIIYIKDLMRMEGISQRTAQRRMSAIRKHFSFRPKFITKKHYALYCGLNLEDVDELMQ